MNTLKRALSWILWPLLFTVCMLVAGYGLGTDRPVLYFNIAYILLILSLWRLEIWMPHEREWHQPDGQNLASILHTLSSKGTVQALMIFSGVIGLAEYITPLADSGSHGIWPVGWPLWAQVVLGVVVAELPLYWGHRLAHETPVLWRFHAIHHSVVKLWFLNTGRFHFVDSLKSILPGLLLLMALGAPMEIIQWLSVITAFIGMLTHCNVEMRFGWLSYIFNTPGLHRWHHSKDLHEGNRNYGENIMIWDIVFGTYYDADYRPPADIGIKEPMPARFIHQLLWPFVGTKTRRRLMPGYEPAPFLREEKS